MAAALKCRYPLRGLFAYPGMQYVREDHMKDLDVSVCKDALAIVFENISKLGKQLQKTGNVDKRDAEKHIDHLRQELLQIPAQGDAAPKIPESSKPDKEGEGQSSEESLFDVAVTGKMASAETPVQTFENENRLKPPM